MGVDSDARASGNSSQCNVLALIFNSDQCWRSTISTPPLASIQTPVKTKTKVSLILSGCVVLVLLVLLVVVAARRLRHPDQPLQLWTASFSADGKTLVTGGAHTPASQLRRQRGLARRRR